MGSAISIGTTGLAASSKQMDVIGNNLANSNTLGFKAGTTYFASMLNQSLSSSGALAVGQGVTVSAVATQFAQGSFETTGNATDLAIDGEGFFVLQDVNDASFYTRAGAFHVNKEGLLVDGNNYTVQGFSVPKTTASISTDTEGETLQDISFDNAMSNAKATTEVSIGANLDDTTAYGEKFNVYRSPS
jgi:flagellar hook protein FlgE